MAKLNQRPTFTDEQLSQYLGLLFGETSKYSSPDSVRRLISEDPVKTVSVLQRKHMGAIPWGSIGLHYSATKELSLETDKLFDKIVAGKIGGYCMEVGTLFSTVLGSLGIKHYLTGGRISDAVVPLGGDPEAYAGYEHEIIIAQLGDQTYHVDVGFANLGPVSPILLVDGTTVPGVPGIQVRLVREVIAESVSGQKWWVLKSLDETSQQWKNCYCFGEQEFLPQDFAYMNYRTSQDPQSWFTKTLILAKLLVSEGEEGEIRGTMTLTGDTLEKRIGANKSEVVKKCTTEAERVAVLREYFGMDLTQEQQDGIKGTSTEIKNAN